jgi:hypothetical protein
MKDTPLEKANARFTEVIQEYNEARKKIQQIVKGFEEETGCKFSYSDIGCGNFFYPDSLELHVLPKEDREFYINRIKDIFKNQVEVVNKNS